MPTMPLVPEKMPTVAVGCRIGLDRLALLNLLAKREGIKHSTYIKRLLNAHLRRMERKEAQSDHPQN